MVKFSVIFPSEMGSPGPEKTVLTASVGKEVTQTFSFSLKQTLTSYFTFNWLKAFFHEIVASQVLLSTCPVGVPLTNGLPAIRKNWIFEELQI